MTLIIDVLMPVGEPAYLAAASRELETYHAAFGARGMTLRARPWTDGPGDGDATLALFAWGYHLDVAKWRAMISGWPAARPLFNPAALLDWNTCKTYLLELEAAGVPILPSIFGRADADSVAAAFDRFGVDELVVKPQISGGSFRTERVARGSVIKPLDDAIIQPFIPAVSGEGELSFLLIGGVLSHAVRKVAIAGDFRVQPQFGGVFTRFDPDAAQLALVGKVMAALPGRPLYARVDLLRLPDGTLALMELEAIEPDLYPHLEPEVPALLADALANALAGLR
ncbi:MAG: transporter [Pseudomonadota bacterium]